MQFYLKNTRTVFGKVNSGQGTFMNCMAIKEWDYDQSFLASWCCNQLQPYLLLRTAPLSMFCVDHPFSADHCLAMLRPQDRRDTPCWGILPVVALPCIVIPPQAAAAMDMSPTLNNLVYSLVAGLSALAIFGVIFTSAESSKK